jgi:hypothetical protein
VRDERQQGGDRTTELSFSMAALGPSRRDDRTTPMIARMDPTGLLCLPSPREDDPKTGGKVQQAACMARNREEGPPSPHFHFASTRVMEVVIAAMIDRG